MLGDVVLFPSIAESPTADPSLSSTAAPTLLARDSCGATDACAGRRRPSWQRLLRKVMLGERPRDAAKLEDGYFASRPLA
jgi:hypothetical protein